MVRIIAAVAQGETVDALLFADQNHRQAHRPPGRHPFYRRQKRTILARNEKVDPIRITDAIEAGGYAALARALQRGEPRWVIDEVKAAGCAGAAVPASRPASSGAARQAGERPRQVLVCNADEGDPGAYMDRAVSRGNPHGSSRGCSSAPTAPAPTAA